MINRSYAAYLKRPETSTLAISTEMNKQLTRSRLRSSGIDNPVALLDLPLYLLTLSVIQ